jgi:predicted O-linked N-acetylglucosamine transferase (SPINDLY family)
MASSAQRRLKKVNGKAAGQTGGGASDAQILALLTEGHKAHLAGNIAFAERRYREVLKLRPTAADAWHLLGVLCLKRGEAAEAVGLIGRAIALDPKPKQFHVNYAAALFHSGRPEEAEQEYRRVIERDPQAVDAYRNLATILGNGGRVEGAIDCLKRGVSANPGLARMYQLLAEFCLKYDRHEDAAEAYRKGVDLEPADDVLRSDLGYVLGKLGRHQEAVDVLMPAYRRGSTLPDLHNNLGNSLRHLRRLDEAEETLTKAIALDPTRWQFKSNLAGAYYQQGRVNEALEVFEQLYRDHPGEMTPTVDLATCYVRTGRAQLAIPMLRKAVEMMPESAEAWNALGVAYSALNHYEDAEAAFRRGLEYEPANFHLNDNLACVLRSNNRYDEANVAAHVVLSLPTYRPSDFLNVFQIFHNTCDYDGVRQLGDVEVLCDQVAPLALTGAIFDMMVHAATPDSTRRLVALHRKWGMAIEAQVAERPLPPLAARAKRARLRIGLLSSDLRSHAVGRHLLPLLRNYDRDRFEIYGYTPWDYTNDQTRHEIAGLIQDYRDVSNMRVREIAEAIRRDEIDVLFDLNGHTLGSKMEALAYRAAPVQIAWLGYPFTSGLKDIDYFLLDDRIRPTANDLLLEKSLIMPEAWVTFGEYPEVLITDELPFERNGFVTFGTLNNPYKYTPQTIAAWARVMQAVPDSRMIFVRREVDSRVLCLHIAQEFARHGVNASRLFFLNNHRQGIDFLQCYHQLDMTMDTFPVTGGTTTCDATWMGVPVVTLVGEAIHQRVSYAILDRIGLGELCAHSVDEFVEKAVTLANSPDDLRFLRQNMRESVRSSIFYDGPRYAKQFCDTIWDLARQHGLV